MITKKMLGFGLVLFLMLVMLSVFYGQSMGMKQLMVSDPAWVPTDQSWKNQAAPSAKKTPLPLPATVTPETTADDLVDEALADRDDLTSLVEDEMADIEEGN